MNDEWGTEQALFDRLNREFDFEIDLAASHQNALLPVYITKEENSLAQEWSRWPTWKFLNPPFSRGNMEKFSAKVVADAAAGGLTVMLCKFDPSCAWYQDFVHNKAAEIYMLAHRIKFKGAKDQYPWPCCVAIYTGKLAKKSKYTIWSWR